MQGSFAYLVSEYDGLQVIDVSEPVTPTLRGTFAMTTRIRAFSIEVAGDLAYLTYQSDSLIPPTGGLQIIDISDPISPTLRGSFETD